MTATYAIATAPLRASRHWRQDTITWDELVRWVKSPAGEKECGNYLMGELVGGRRSNATVKSRSMLALDVDAARADFNELFEIILGVRAIVHSTFKSTADAPRFRVLIPLPREITPDEYVYAAQRVIDLLGADQFDPGSVEPARYMFKPSAKDPTEYMYRIFDGPFIDVDNLLTGFEQREVPRSRTQKRDPYQLEGTVGAFNRAYSIDEAIAAFAIPYDREAEGRWTLRGASSAAGVSQVAEGLVYSHHANDPAFGQTCSAFDLVRIHRYGDLDADAEAGTPINRLPSFAAMQEEALRHAEVLRELGEFEPYDTDDDTDDHDDQSWRLDLVRNPRTGKVEDSINNWDLIRRNDPMFRGLYYNQFTLATETSADRLPWRTIDPLGVQLTTVDRAQVGFHLEREYGIRPSKALADDLINAQAQTRVVNPVRDYLLGLPEWDGVPRVDTSLPGVEPTLYARMVARKCLTAAVARALDPGVKWDHMLILQGAEGLGKTTWINRLSRGWSAPLGAINDKDTLLAIHRSWIVVSDEGYSLRKAESDSLKEFLTRSEDVVRLPYDRETTAHRRHCVIWGTTNDQTFLRKQEGNRRFLVVACTRPINIDSLTDAYVDQLWAEALHHYRAGEPLFLDTEQNTLARQEREAYEEEDTLLGLILNYLDTPVAEGWIDRPVEARIDWLSTRDLGLEKGTELIQEVCSAQIWVEAMRQPIGRARRMDFLEINETLRNLPGWEKAGHRRVAGYGPQRVFVRKD